MPERTRAGNGRLCARPKRGRFLVCWTAFSAICTPGWAQALTDDSRNALGGLRSYDIATLAVVLGLLVFAIMASVALLRVRRHAARIDHVAREETAQLRSEVERLHAMVLAEPQVILAWPADDDGGPEITGDSTLISPGITGQRILHFAEWLPPRLAALMEQALQDLRGQGRGFTETLTTLTGRLIEAEGKIIGGRAVLRLRDVGGVRRDLADLKTRYDHLLGTAEMLRHLIDALPAPVWARDDTGLLTFVNSAYVRAVEAADATEAVENGIELFDRPARGEVAKARAAGSPYRGRLPAIAAGARRVFDAVDVPSAYGSAGMAVDATEIESMRAELGRMIEAHRRILDQLPTGVAVFDARQRLTFYNAAYRALFELKASLLDQHPTDSVLLDQLRATRQVPEERDFREWKAALHTAYRAVEAKEQTWHLPDGRTLRVVTMPNPEGGVTYLFHDVTERLEMTRRFDALIKVQSETLDHLAEAVAVFGSDGRIRLHNPAFARMWKLTPDTLNQRPHIEAVTAWCQALHDDGKVWRALRGAVTAIEDRAPIVERIERKDGMLIDCTTMPLPDGATLVTFQDVTDTLQYERALRERNEALEAADQIKVEFVHHVSYELRSPLTNIIGFAHFLSDPSFGPLTEKQHEYLGYITASTNALLALINNILDLATIDAGAMTLNLGEVDIRDAMNAAAEGIQDRLVKGDLRLDIRAAPGIGSFTADERRIRQVLFNLLSNAVGFSPAHETVTLSAERRPDAVIFKVIDHGPGIPQEARDKVFEWFETDPRGSEHRGSGLGLSLVRSFVELHGGAVTIDSEAGQGTTVTCVFPLRQAAKQSAA